MMRYMFENLLRDAQSKSVALPFSPDELRRIAWYDLFLYITMMTEGFLRQYSNIEGMRSWLRPYRKPPGRMCTREAASFFLSGRFSTTSAMQQNNVQTLQIPALQTARISV